MSFGAEFRKMRETGGSPKVTAEAATEAATAATEKVKAEAAAPEEETAEAVFQNPFVDGQTLEAVAQDGDEPPVIPAPKPEQAQKKIKINGKTFDTMEDAADYAAKLEIELEKKEAVEKALEAQKPKTEAPKIDKATKKIAEKFFEDPEAAFDEFDELVTKKARQMIEEMDKQKTEAAKAKSDAESAWQGFYKSNSDLVDWQEEVNLVTQRNWELIKDLPANKGLEEIAKQTRAYINSLKEKALPKQVLSSKVVNSPTSGLQSATATKKQTTEKKISFIDQVRSTSKRTAMQSES